MGQQGSSAYFLSNVAPGTYGPATLMGGKYSVTWKSTGGGTLQLQVLAPDLATYVNAGAVINANGVTTLDLPDAQYQFVLATGTANYLAVQRVQRYFSQ